MKKFQDTYKPRKSAEQSKGNGVKKKKPFHRDTADKHTDLIEGRNAVMELMRSGRSVDKLYVAKDSSGGSISQIISMARKSGAPISYCDRKKLDGMSVTGAHQGVIAVAAAHTYAELDDIIAAAKSSYKPPLIVLCDGITDPRNLGAIIRSAEIFGADGVVISKHGAAGLNAACAKAAAGALEYVPVARCSSMSSAARKLKENGIWIFGMGAEGETPICNADFSLPCAVVIGSEGDGMSEMVRKECDFIVSIPMQGKINSLNASAAAAIALYACTQARNK